LPLPSQLRVPFNRLKALRTKDTEDVSIRFLLVLIAGISLRVIYGIGRADIVIVKGKSIGASLNI